MRPVEEIAAKIVQSFGAVVNEAEMLELAKAVLFWVDRFDRAQEQYDELHRESHRLRDALRIAETTRNAAQAVATRETERRREVEAMLVECNNERADARLELASWLEARAEAEAMRELAWRWCIEADGWREAAHAEECIYREKLERLQRRVPCRDVDTGEMFDPGGGVVVETSTGTLVVRAGDVLEGAEGDVTTRILVTYVSEETVLARELRSWRSDASELAHADGEVEWSLEERDWRIVENTDQERRS